MHFLVSAGYSVLSCWESTSLFGPGLTQFWWHMISPNMQEASNFDDFLGSWLVQIEDPHHFHGGDLKSPNEAALPTRKKPPTINPGINLCIVTASEEKLIRFIFLFEPFRKKIVRKCKY